MVIKWRQIAKVLVRIAVTTLLLVWVFSKIDFQQFRQTVENARWQYLIAVWGFTAIFFLIQSISMQIILKKQGCTVSLNTLLVQCGHLTLQHDIAGDTQYGRQMVYT